LAAPLAKAKAERAQKKTDAHTEVDEYLKRELFAKVDLQKAAADLLTNLRNQANSDRVTMIYGASINDTYKMAEMALAKRIYPKEMPEQGSSKKTTSGC
jgi:hypothetical protein